MSRVSQSLEDPTSIVALRKDSKDIGKSSHFLLRQLSGREAGPWPAVFMEGSIHKKVVAVRDHP